MSANEPHLCIAPACFNECSYCSCAISPENMRKYAVRYALLQRMDPRFGMPAEWLRFKTLDEAVDSELAALATGALALERPKPEPCPLGKGQNDPDCTNRHQCWEPCGELGKSEDHVRVGQEPAAKFSPAVQSVALADSPTPPEKNETQTLA